MSCWAVGETFIFCEFEVCVLAADVSANGPSQRRGMWASAALSFYYCTSVICIIITCGQCAGPPETCVRICLLYVRGRGSCVQNSVRLQQYSMFTSSGAGLDL